MTVYHQKLAGVAASVLFHTAAFAYGAVAWVGSPQYGVESGAGGMEISLTAAPAEQAVVTISEAETLEPKPILPTDSDAVTLPEEKNDILESGSALESPKIHDAQKSTFKGDGSSALPGKDATTFYSGGGALTEAAPYYLKNPAPTYPWEARKNGWEGSVFLKVLVGKSGNASQIEVEQSSGYLILDQSALKSVKKWRFRAAQVGSLPVESLVRIPIRFQLGESDKDFDYREE